MYWCLHYEQQNWLFQLIILTYHTRNVNRIYRTLQQSYPHGLCLSPLTQLLVSHHPAAGLYDLAYSPRPYGTAYAKALTTWACCSFRQQRRGLFRDIAVICSGLSYLCHKHSNIVTCGLQNRNFTGVVHVFNLSAII